MPHKRERHHIGSRPYRPHDPLASPPTTFARGLSLSGGPQQCFLESASPPPIAESLARFHSVSDDIESKLEAIEQDLKKNRQMFESQKSYLEIIRWREKWFCEMDLLTSVFTALGHNPKTQSRGDFFRALRSNPSLCREIVRDEIGGSADDFEKIISILGPRREREIVKCWGQSGPYRYTLGNAKFLASHPDLKQWLKLLLEGQSEEKRLQDAALIARNRLSQRYPGLYQLGLAPEQRQGMTPRRGTRGGRYSSTSWGGKGGRKERSK